MTLIQCLKSALFWAYFLHCATEYPYLSCSTVLCIICFKFFKESKASLVSFNFPSIFTLVHIKTCDSASRLEENTLRTPGGHIWNYQWKTNTQRIVSHADICLFFLVFPNTLSYSKYAHFINSYFVNCQQTQTYF